MKISGYSTSTTSTVRPSSTSPVMRRGSEKMASDPNKKINKSQNSLYHRSDSEKETWFEGVNKALPEVNINIFKEAIAIAIAEQTFKNIKKNYGSKPNE